MVTWLHLRTHHFWRTLQEVGLLSEDHLPQSMTQPVQLHNQAIHLHPNTSHFAHYTISTIEGVATHAPPLSSCFCPPSSPSHIPLIPPFHPGSLSHPPTQRCGLPTEEALFPGSLAGPLYTFSCLALQVSCRAWIACLCSLTAVLCRCVPLTPRNASCRMVHSLYNAPATPIQNNGLRSIIALGCLSLMSLYVAAGCAA